MKDYPQYYHYFSVRSFTYKGRTYRSHNRLLKKYKGNKSAEEFLAYQRYEAELFRKYKAYYGFVFYIGKKT